MNKFKAFMVPELKEEQVYEFPGLETFKDENGIPIPLKIKGLPREKVKDIRNKYKKRVIAKDKKGNPLINGNMAVYDMDYDGNRATNHILVEAMVFPDLKDPELMAFYGVNDVTEMPDKLFRKESDNTYVFKCLSKALGYEDSDGIEADDDDETVDNLKN